MLLRQSDQAGCVGATRPYFSSAPVYEAGGGAARTDNPCGFGRRRENWKLVEIGGSVSGSIQVVSMV